MKAKPSPSSTSDTSSLPGSDTSTTSRSDASPRRRTRHKNPLLGVTSSVRTKGGRFASVAQLEKWKPRKNPLLVSPAFRHPMLDDEERVVGEAAENPGAISKMVTRATETVAGSLGGYGWNYLAGETIRSMGLSPTTNELVGYVASAAPALAFATLFSGDEPWKAAMAGASLYDFWLALARRVGVGQVEPSPPAGAT